MSALSLSQILLDLAAVSAVVAALISQFVQPLLGSVPALAPSAPDQTLRNMALRAANLLLSVAGVLIMASVQGQLAWANIVPTAAAVITVALGAHAAYKVIPAPSSPVPTAASVGFVTIATTQADPAPTAAQIAAAGMIAQPPAAI